MQHAPSELIVLSSEPNYPALTPAEIVAVERIRRRAIRRRNPEPPLPPRLALIWTIALLSCMAARGLTAWFDPELPCFVALNAQLPCNMTIDPDTATGATP